MPGFVSDMYSALNSCFLLPFSLPSAGIIGVNYHTQLLPHFLAIILHHPSPSREYISLSASEFMFEDEPVSLDPLLRGFMRVSDSSTGP
jgi:hypothetical protein